MALVTLNRLLNRAEADGYGVGAFNVGNMEMIRGVVRAAEETETPVIMQLGEKRLAYSPLDLMAPMMVQAAKSASVDIAVHFDHGTNIGNLKKALDYGFTSVMFDGSSLSFEENAERTLQVVKLASRYGADVEAELGHVGNNSDSSETDESEKESPESLADDRRFTKPDDAAEFCERTGIDALAVAIGNAHGTYPVTPKLSFGTLEKINAAVDTPLVLHGGTGISPEDFRHAIRSGITKINIATANYDNTAAFALEYMKKIMKSKKSSKANYFELSESEMMGTYQNVRKHIGIFNMK